MKFADASKVINYYNGSELAKNESNDCSVRAFAGLLNTKYEPAHSFVADKFNREMKKGVLKMNSICDKMAEENKTYEIDGVQFKMHSLKKSEITNTYKLRGEYIVRNKTVKSFVKSHPEGNYLIFVSGHVFSLKDGTIIDNNGEEYRPTRKVLGAMKVEVVDNQGYLELF